MLAIVSDTCMLIYGLVFIFFKKVFKAFQSLVGFIDPISLLFQDPNAGYNALMYDSFTKCRSGKPQLSATVAGYPVIYKQ